MQNQLITDCFTTVPICDCKQSRRTPCIYENRKINFVFQDHKATRQNPRLQKPTINVTFTFLFHTDCKHLHADFALTH